MEVCKKVKKQGRMSTTINNSSKEAGIFAKGRKNNDSGNYR